MSDTSFFSKERHRISPDVAERVRARWSMVYYAVEAIHSSEIVEHGGGLIQPQTAAPQPAAHAPASKREAVQAAQIGSNVFDLEAYQAQRQQTAQEVESMERQRLAEQARLNAEAAFYEEGGEA